ncbi:MAG: hypothetical protein LIP06_09350, partial [Tannerellaceae bacterium]|nr:hypothetical protein [Tannerellaceae bacterium]
IGEFNKLNELFYQLTSSANWLCSPWPVNKPNVLYCAAKVGLHIPQTIITSSNSKIGNHLLNKGRLLCKTLGDGFSLKVHNKNYFIAPQLFNNTKKLPEIFFPSLTQEYIDKNIDIRIFYLNKTFFAGAIFSQLAEITKIDFRITTLDMKPLRIAPIELDPETQKKLISLMDKIHLNIGVIDMVLYKDEYYFLEINPCGQFGELANVCGYNIYQEIANYLIRVNYEHKKI